MLKTKTLFLLFIILLVSGGCSSIVRDGIVRGPGAIIQYEEFTFNTTDNITLVADFYDAPTTKGLILLHMSGRTRASYRDIAPDLLPNYKIVAIDFRGHGDSQGAYEDLTENDFNLMVRDVEAAALFLQTEGVAPKNISVAGASVGANLALLYATEHPVDKLVLLAPGLRYRGVAIDRISYDKPVFMQVGYYDAYSSISVDDLELLLSGARTMKYESSGHGTDLLASDISAREDFLFYLT